MGRKRKLRSYLKFLASDIKFIRRGFPGGSDNEESACNGRDPGLISGSGRSPGEGNGYPPQYSCLENSIDRGAWWAIVHWIIKESDTT